MMIKKLIRNRFLPPIDGSQVIDKINEIIDTLNKQTNYNNQVLDNTKTKRGERFE